MTHSLRKKAEKEMYKLGRLNMAECRQHVDSVLSLFRTVIEEAKPKKIITYSSMGEIANMSREEGISDYHDALKGKLK